MPGKKNRGKPYKIVGAYDSETANITGKQVFAYPISHQLGLLKCNIEQVTPENVHDVCDVSIYRHAIDLFLRLDDIAATQADYVPVIMCHNLAFDMYGLAPWLAEHDVKVLAKSQRKPITFTIRDDSGKPSLVLWDTLVFSGQGLERMGRDAGYAKAVGKWDYELVRTPYTPLTENELTYAKDDIYSLCVWLSWWLARNPEISPEMLGLNVVTKTGVVRARRKARFQNLKWGRSNIGRQWMFINRQQAPKTDDELFTMQASTRGGFTFCAMHTASIPFDLRGTEYTVAAYDATSQHPAQMVSHRYPVNFHETTPDVLTHAFELVSHVPVSRVLDRWSKPFAKAFYACFTFMNIRPKPGSLFEKHGIFPLASARFTDNSNVELDDDNGDAATQEDMRRVRGYADICINPHFAFGKLVSADSCTVYLTELAAWEVSQAYVWDDMHARHGYITGRFVRPSDMAVISVMNFYAAKNAFKEARGEYFSTGFLKDGENLRKLGIAENFVSDMENGALSDIDIDAQYLSLKADLNALFGIEASNEYRRDTILTPAGIEYTGDIGLCNAPKNNKAWYQFGQRIVGWSRIAQICVMHLINDEVEHIVNGDTDSIKVVVCRDKLKTLERKLALLARAIDKGKVDNCDRVRGHYHEFYDPLDGIGHYVCEFVTDRFCAAWNKAYCEVDSKDRYSFTLAGVPTRGKGRLDDLATRMDTGGNFGELCDILLGYNLTFAHDVTGLNARKFPQWASFINERVTDYKGETRQVMEPHALALYPMSKTIGSTSTRDNRVNLSYARVNRASVNSSQCILTKEGVVMLDA